MIASMTGFGTAEGTLGAGRVTVEIRSVNHRFFTPSIKLPQSLARFEGDVRDTLRRRIARGHVSVTVKLELGAETALALDEERIATYVATLRRIAERHSLPQELDMATLLRLPGVLDDSADALAARSPVELVAVTGRALDDLIRMRAEEGRRLADAVLERLGSIEAAVNRIAVRAPARLVEQRERLQRSVQELAAGIAIDPQRLAQEVVLLADKLDVSEELDRCRSHLAAFRAALVDSGAEPVGKRLGFILQEMLRETNTTGSKANDAAMLADVVTIKEELERVREQVENLE